MTYARKAAGLAAIENLHGKRADNGTILWCIRSKSLSVVNPTRCNTVMFYLLGQILKVTMRKNAIIHGELAASTSHVPTSIHGPMKLLEKAVKGT